MEWFLPGIFFPFVNRVLVSLHVRGCLGLSLSWWRSGLYALSALGLSSLTYSVKCPLPLTLLLEIFLLGIVGAMELPSPSPRADKKATQLGRSLAVASLSFSLLSVATGTMSSLFFWITDELSGPQIWALQWMDTIDSLCTTGLLLVLLYYSRRVLRDSLLQARGPMLYLLSFPTLFTTLAEWVLSQRVYGDTVIWDAQRGLVSPQANHGEMLLVHCLACLGLAAAVFSCRQLHQAFFKEQQMRLLEEQAKTQSAYVKEAQERLTQNYALHHDVKNHFLVLQGLLQEKQVEQAQDYLANLEQWALPQPFPCHTNNPSVDVLLGSKLALARQKGISVSCSLSLPAQSPVTDADWCILLSNAVDNAITAAGALPTGEGYLRLTGQLLGTAYLISLENNCLPSPGPLQRGTGFGNMQAVCEKYRGKLEAEAGAHTFRLDLLVLLMV